MVLVEVSGSNEWDKFAEKGRHSHVYQLSGMAKVMSAIGFKARFFALEKNNKRKAQLMVLEKSASRTRFLKNFSRSWLSYSPPILLCSEKEEREIFKEFIFELQKKAKSERIAWITIWSLPLWDPVDWFFETGFEASIKENAVLELLEDKEKTWNALYKHARRDVRKGKETEAFARKAESLKEMREFYSIYESHHVQLGLKPYPWKYFEFFWNELVEKNKGLLVVTQLNEEIVAGMLVGFIGDYIYEFTNSVKPEAYKCFPTDLMNWWLIEWAVPRSFKYFDLSNVAVGKMNSKEEAIKRFKKKWGSLHQYHEFKWFTGKTKKLAVKGLKKLKGN